MLIKGSHYRTECLALILLRHVTFILLYLYDIWEDELKVQVLKILALLLLLLLSSSS